MVYLQFILLCKPLNPCYSYTVAKISSLVWEGYEHLISLVLLASQSASLTSGMSSAMDLVANDLLP